MESSVCYLQPELVCQVRTTTMLPLSDSTPDLPKALQPVGDDTVGLVI